jgi:aspartyl-tRNA(Asn)/glutamyl-tRNA(Gln) amidotransferase subunit C
MAEITKSEVEYVADLAKLTLSDEDKQRLTKELGAILEYVGKLNEVDTEGVEPMMHAAGAANVFRDDEQRQGLERDEALANAPRSDGAYFLVPRILDTEQ